MLFVDQDYKDPNKKKKGFYIAMAVCIFAIFAAICSTYQSAKELISFNNLRLENDFSNLDSDEFEINDYNVNPKNNLNKEESKLDTILEETQAVNNPKIDCDIVYPLNNRCETIRGYSEDPVYSPLTNDWRSHRGIELKVKTGEEVKSVTAGKVLNITEDPIFKKKVEVEQDTGNNKFSIIYKGVSPVVKKNQILKPGQSIGKVVQNPCTNKGESILYVITKKDDKFIEPIKLIPNLNN